MKRHRKQPIPAEVIVFWRTRYAALHQRLIETPGAQDAWFWQIQCEIFAYFLNRYSDGIQPIPPGQTPPTELFKGSSPAPLEVKPSNSFNAPAGAGKLPRTFGKIRLMLANIIQVNQERYELHQRLRSEMMELMRIERQRIRDAIRRDLPFADLYKPKPAPKPDIEVLSDDEAVNLLSEMLLTNSPPEEVGDHGEEKEAGV